MCGKSKIVMVPCELHLPRGRSFTLGDALGDLFWVDSDGSSVRFASCRECDAGLPPYVEADMMSLDEMMGRVSALEHHPRHKMPKEA